MPKVCICLYGLVQRSLKYTINSIKKNILEELSKNGMDYDIYLHTYDSSISHSPRAGEIHVQVDPDDYKLLEPHVYSVESYTDFNNNYDYEDFMRRYKDPWGDNYESIKNWIREMHSMHRVTTMWEDKKSDYEFCLYIRPDLMYITPLPFDYITRHLRETNYSNTWFTPPWGKWGGLNDFLAFGDCESMIKWGKRIDSVYEFMDLDGFRNSERHMELVLNKYNIQNIDLPILCYRVRANGNKKLEDWEWEELSWLKEKCIKEGGKINTDFYNVGQG
jgi:hypothetical protein